MRKIEGFETLAKMRCLYLQENLIAKIEGLEGMPILYQLNLSNNCLVTIENLGGCALDTLYLNRNRIGRNGLSDLMGLLECPTLTTLDLQNNLIDDEACVDEVFCKMPTLKVLYLQNNPVCKKIRNYRKIIISKIPTLMYLDDRPVFEEDRRHAEAFVRGGLDEERAERVLIKKENDEKHMKQHLAFKNMIANARAEKAEADRLAREAQGLPEPEEKQESKVEDSDAAPSDKDEVDCPPELE